MICGRSDTNLVGQRTCWLTWERIEHAFTVSGVNLVLHIRSFIHSPLVALVALYGC